MVFKPNYAIFRLNNMEALPKRRVRKKKELYVSALFVSCFGTVLVLKCPSHPLHNVLDMHNNPPHNHIAWSLREHRHKTSVLLLASFASSHTLWVHIVKNDWATGYVPILGQSLKIGICHYDTGGIEAFVLRYVSYFAVHTPLVNLSWTSIIHNLFPHGTDSQQLRVIKLCSGHLRLLLQLKTSSESFRLKQHWTCVLFFLLY